MNDLPWLVVLINDRIGQPRTEQVVARFRDHKAAQLSAEAMRGVYVVPAMVVHVTEHKGATR